jgi:hypothetical protein
MAANGEGAVITINGEDRRSPTVQFSVVGVTKRRFAFPAVHGLFIGRLFFEQIPGI